MKNFAVIIFLCLYPTFQSLSQEGWFWQNPYPIGNYLSDVEILDTNTVIAVSGAYTTIKTTDKGETWKVYNSNLLELLYSVKFIDTVGWAAGNLGKIIKTTDAGVTWSILDSGTEEDLYSIFFINELIGWAAGWDGTLVKTTDGGENWISLMSGATSYITSITFTNKDTGWYCGHQGIFKTTNGGEYWELKMNTGASIARDIYFISYELGWVTAGSSVYKTTDGGDHWSEIPIGIYNDPLSSICFINDSIGFTIGREGTILKSQDSGFNWEIVNSSTERDLWSIKFLDQANGWIVGANGTILQTSDSGTTWNKISKEIGIGRTLQSITSVDSLLVWAVGYKTILHTSDGGDNWIEQFLNNQYKLTDISFGDHNHGWAVGQGESLNGAIIYTSNSGNDWILQASFPQIQYLWGADFINNQIGWVVGMDGKIFYTNNRGENWIEQNSGITEDLLDVEFIDSLVGWACGGFILKTIDGGNNWEIKLADSLNYINSISFPTKLTGYASSVLGNILKSTDGGETWESQYILDQASFRSVFFVDKYNGWILCFDLNTFIPFTLKTTDGGNNWSREKLICMHDLQEITFADGNNGWIVGYEGSILKTNSAGIVISVNDNKHIQFYHSYFLFTNYPNPFNPSTTIKFQIPKLSFVTLKVYDVLGNEIVTLVNEEKPAGTYEVDFDGTALPSGIYFYRLKSGNYLEIKKMILLK